MSDDEFQRREDEQLKRSGLWSAAALLGMCIAGWAAVAWFLVSIPNLAWW